MITSLQLSVYSKFILASMNYFIPADNLAQFYPETDWDLEYSNFAENVVEYSFSHDPLVLIDLDRDNQIDDTERELGQFYTAQLITAIAYNETGFRHSTHIRGDHGQSICALQINANNTFRVQSKWTREEIEEDMNKCLDLGYKTLAWSINKGGRNYTDKLTGYVSGHWGKGKSSAWARCSTFVKMVNYSAETSSEIESLDTRKVCGML